MSRNTSCMSLQTTIKIGTRCKRAPAWGAVIQLFMGYSKRTHTMDKFLTILLCGFFLANLTYGQLNQKIDESQKKAIVVSPFKTAKGLNKEISQQRKIRLEYLGIIDSLKIKFPKDTIFLTENYDFICLGCPADYIQILYKNNLLTIRKYPNSNNYKRENSTLTNLYFDEQGFYYSDIHEIISEIRKSDSWFEKPEKYGTDNCFDGGHTFYTVIYPDNKINSMYMRCWINKEFRKHY
jgi:hypothetical protein